MITLGIDTSNYTTSCALYDSESGTIIQQKKLLPVKPGEKGLRQSDAVFHHTVQLPCLMENLFAGSDCDIDSIGYSLRPRDVEGSYMPCFLVGGSVARSISAEKKVPLYSFSHQAGHITAALFSSGRLDLVNEKFIAFHVSGGTTEMLLVRPDYDRIFSIEIIGCTGDLNCGQAVDRTGVMLGLPFPCGKHIEALALKSEMSYSPKVSVREGNCSLSGLENQCRKMIDSGESPENVSRYCLTYITKTIEKMTEWALEKYGNLPVVYAGGVMSDVLIRETLQNSFDAYFAAPEYSCDNAAGTAILAYLKTRR